MAEQYREERVPLTAHEIEREGWACISGGLRHLFNSDVRRHGLRTRVRVGSWDVKSVVNGVRMVRAARLIRKYGLDLKMVPVEQKEAS
jgi:hypothetical protein